MCGWLGRDSCPASGPPRTFLSPSSTTTMPTPTPTTGKKQKKNIKSTSITCSPPQHNKQNQSPSRRGKGPRAESRTSTQWEGGIAAVPFHHFLEGLFSSFLLSFVGGVGGRGEKKRRDARRRVCQHVFFFCALPPFPSRPHALVAVV